MAHTAAAVAKTVAAPVLSGCLESGVANRAEAQRFFGPDQFTKSGLGLGLGLGFGLASLAGAALSRGGCLPCHHSPPDAHLAFRCSPRVPLCSPRVPL